jgi:hypothetical protein
MLSKGSIFFPFLPGQHEVKGFASPHIPLLSVCVTTGPKAAEPTGCGLKPLKPGVKINLPSIKLILSGVLFITMEAD